MKTLVPSLLFVCVTLSPVAGAREYAVPKLRHANYVVWDAPNGALLSVDLACISHGYRAYQDDLHARLFNPEGLTAAELSVAPGEKRRLTANVDWAGRCALELNSGWNLVQLSAGAAPPHAYRSRVRAPLTTVGAWGPLHFYVPMGTTYFNVWLRASVRGEGLHFVMRDPAGKIVREEDGDFDKRTKIQTRLEARSDGAAWSVLISRPTSPGMYLDDVSLELGRHLPPFLAATPEWAADFARGWSYDDAAPKVSSRLPGRDATLPPFKGVRSGNLDVAYARTTEPHWRTSLPFTYVLDYGSKHLGHPEYLEQVAGAPPGLLHLGKDVPFNHGWGPVKSLGGENQAYGKGEYIERISPEQVEVRIQDLRAMGEKLHAAGVRWITPYVCAMTVNGDPKRRKGFWDFYDHWKDYESLGLSPRPKADPFEWLQLTKNGAPRIYYGYKYPDEFYPPFGDNHRFAACWQTAGWQTWLSDVIRFIARCDFDGVFVDNGTSQRCECPRCLAAFRRFVAERYSTAESKRLFRYAPERVGFPSKDQVLLQSELKRFWCRTLSRQMAALKRTGSAALGREFIIFPNGGRPAYIQRGLANTDFVMFEKSHGEYGTHPGTVMVPIVDGIHARACNDNIFEYKFVQSLRSRVRPIILSRAGYPQRQSWLVLNHNAARLGIAECGAFSGGGGFLLRPRFDLYHDALNEGRKFFEEHAELFAGLDSYAQTAVLAWPEQGWLGNMAHMGEVKKLTKALSEHHVLFDFVPETRFSRRVLQRYRTVVVPRVHVISAAALKTLEEYARAGGRLIIIGDFAAQDERLEQRDMTKTPWGPVLDTPAGTSATWQAGSVRRCQDAQAAARALAQQHGILEASNQTPSAKLPHVKVNAYCSFPETARQRIVIHFVNYNVRLGIEQQTVTPVEGLKLRMRLPEDTSVSAASTVCPENTIVTQLSPGVSAGVVSLSLPPLSIYRLVELRLSAPSQP